MEFVDYNKIDTIVDTHHLNCSWVGWVQDLAHRDIWVWIDSEWIDILDWLG